MIRLVHSPLSAAYLITIAVLVQSLLLLTPTFSFSIITTFPIRSTARETKWTLLSMAQSQPSQQRPAQFELQELNAQLSAMRKSKISPRMLTSQKQAELQTYLREILIKCPSPIPLRSLGDDDARCLHGKWRLAFASEHATLGDLPREADVVMKMKENNRCDYSLAFSEKVFGLNNIIAQSTYVVDCSPVNPGLVTFVYQNIVTDVFGMKSIPVGFFGLLKGRANYVETVWFDGNLWVERGYSPKGDEFFNVYVKEV